MLIFEVPALRPPERFSLFTIPFKKQKLHFVFKPRLQLCCEPLGQQGQDYIKRSVITF